MSSSKHDTEDFFKYFEVTYDDETPVSYDETIDISPCPDRKKKCDLSIEDPDYGYDGYYDDTPDYRNRQAEEIESYYPDRDYQKRPKKKRIRHKKHTPVAAPIQKGGKAVYRISKSLVRNLSVILILAITAFMAYSFFRGSAPYGDILQAAATLDVSYTLAAYTAVAAVLILFELFSALWAMTRIRVRDAYGSYKEDVGRGLFSFLFIYICSYLAFLFSKWIPESHELLRGLKGAADVFGSMHNVLFGLCLVGVISCLYRKYSLNL